MSDNAQRGRPASNFSNDERAEFLRIRRSGFGIHNTLVKMGIGYGRFRRTMKADREFRAEANSIDECLIEDLINLRVRAAKEQADADAQEFLINRYDRSKQFVATMKLKRAELKLKQKDAENPDLTTPIVQAIRDAIDHARKD